MLHTRHVCVQTDTHGWTDAKILVKQTYRDRDCDCYRDRDRDCYRDRDRDRDLDVL
jgi:hypothetical protein